MSHIIDEVVLDLTIALLAENHHNGEEERDEQHDGKDQSWNHEPYAGEDVGVHVGEMHQNDSHLR